MSLGIDDLVLVAKELHEVEDSWYTIGRELRVEAVQLKSIKYESKSDSDSCLKKMLSKYLKEPGACWDGVRRALTVIDRGDLAENIRCKFSEAKDISSGATLTMKEIRDIIEKLIPCAAKWRFLGTMLEIPKGILDNIEVKPTNIPGAPRSYLLDMLNYWNDNISSASIKSLAEALRTDMVAEVELAESLLKQFL